MEAIVPAFLFAVLALPGERSAWLAALLADRYRRPITVALAAGLAHAIGIGVAAALGAALIGRLAPNAQHLFVAMALLFAGVSALFPLKAPDRLDRWALGPVLTPLLGVVILAFGDSTQFFVLAVAAGGLPVFAGVGAGLAGFVVAFAAAVLGEASWVRLPLRWLRRGSGAVFLVIATVMALSALRLT